MKNVILFGTFLFSFVFTVETTAQYNDCMFGQCDFGYGVMVYANGEKYVGNWKNGTFLPSKKTISRRCFRLLALNCGEKGARSSSFTHKLLVKQRAFRGSAYIKVW